MQIERGINPNCSEVIMRFRDLSYEDLIRELKTIGIEEIIAENYYNFDIPYDERHANTKIVKVEDMPINLVEAIRQGGTKHALMLSDIDNPSLPDIENGASLYISSPGEYDNPNVSIIGHQHYQVQLYPTINKIERQFGVKPEGHDGGYSFEDDYHNWLRCNTCLNCNKILIKEYGILKCFHCGKLYGKTDEGDGYDSGYDLKEIENDIQLNQCQDCQGTGFIKEICEKCKGKGVV